MVDIGVCILCMAGRFPEKVRWCSSEKVCEGVKCKVQFCEFIEWRPPSKEKTKKNQQMPVII